jgi:hypothetical protein
MSYIFEIFDALPIVHISGQRETGKTRSLELLTELAFNGRLRSSITAASLARQIQRDQPLIALDETEDLTRASPQREIFRLLRAMYRRSGCREVAVGSSTAVYRLFCPVVLVNIGGLDDALRDRTIEIQTLRHPAQHSMDRFFPHREGREIQALRYDLYTFACRYARHSSKVYADFLPEAELSDRAQELWLPLFVMARVVDGVPNGALLQEMVGFAKELRRRKFAEDPFIAQDLKVLAGTFFFLQEHGLLVDPEVEVNAGQLAEFIRHAEQLPALRTEEVARELDRKRLLKRKRRYRPEHHGARLHRHPLTHWLIDVLRTIEQAKGFGLV